AAAPPRHAPRLRRAGRGSPQPDDLDRAGVVPRRSREQRRQLRRPGRPGPLPRQERRPQPGASMSERRCPKCGAAYTDAARFCARDGNMLVEVQSKAATTAPAPGAGTAARTPTTPKPGLERAAVPAPGAGAVVAA